MLRRRRGSLRLSGRALRFVWRVSGQAGQEVGQPQRSEKPQGPAKSAGALGYKRRKAGVEVVDSAGLYEGTVAAQNGPHVILTDPKGPIRLRVCEAHLFCENCGQQFLPVQSVCTRCRVTSTRHWYQLMSLVTLGVAAACNSAVALLVLARVDAGHLRRVAVAHEGFAMRAWLWTDMKAAVYGWIPLALGLLAWDYFVRQEATGVMSEKIKGWLVRGLLIVAWVPGVAPLVPHWLRPPAALMVSVAKLPRLPAIGAASSLTWLLPWAMVALAAAILCINAETRDSLLGHGRILSGISLMVLVMVLMLTLLSLSA